MGAFDRVTFRGKTVDKKTRAALLAAERKLGYQLTIVQGSYNTSVGQSAGTHDLGGAVDLLAWDHERKVQALREVGFAAWFRPELWIGGKRIWGDHIHAVLVDHGNLSGSAARQVEAYRNRRDGLAANGPDNGPQLDPIPVFQYPPRRRTAWITAVLEAKTVDERTDALTRLAKANSKAGRHAEIWLNCLERITSNRRQIANQRAALKKLEVK